MNEAFERLLQRAEQLMVRIEAVLPQPMSAPDWSAAVAWRYRKRSSGHGVLEPVRHVGAMRLGDLQEIDGQKEKIQRNTQQFVQGLPANNVLLTGARGTGKSSLIKACLNEFAPRGLRLIEVDRDDLVDLPLLNQTLLTTTHCSRSALLTQRRLQLKSMTSPVRKLPMCS
mgnify:CR=1 FL=1